MIPAGTVVRSPLVSVDVTATVRSLAGLPRDPGAGGMDMMPALTGRAPLREVAYAEMWDALHDLWQWQMVREGDWKYVAFANGDELLYDLEGDPAELDDLSLRPDLSATLTAAHHCRTRPWRIPLSIAGIRSSTIAAW